MTDKPVPQSIPPPADDDKPDRRQVAPATNGVTGGFRPAKPVALTVRPDGIPPPLKAVDHWVVWRYMWVEDESKEGGGKWDKPPTDAKTGKAASSTDPATWSTFEEAWAAYQRGDLDGIGFVVHKCAEGEEGNFADPFVVVDLDKCIDPETGNLEEWARQDVEDLATYTEKSPSGRGLRCVAIGRLPMMGRKRGVYENYENARYVTITGHHLPGTPNSIENRQAAIEAVHRRHWPPTPPAPPRSPSTASADPVFLSDSEIVEKASRAKNGNKFTQLWEGGTAGYPSQSEADAALLAILRFWTRANPERMAGLFERSGLNRGKWAERPDYRERTLRYVLGQGGDVFEPQMRWGVGRPGPAASETNGTSPSDGGPWPAVQANEAIDDPHRLGRLYLGDYYAPDGLAFRWWRDDWLRHDGRAYRSVNDKEVRAEVNKRIKREFDELNAKATAAWQLADGCDDKGKPCPSPVAKKVTVRLVADTLQALTGLALLTGSVEAPAWVGGSEPYPAKEILACNNTLVHLPSWAEGKVCTLPLTPRFFSLNALDYDFAADAPEPRNWIEFLQQIWPNDMASIETLQEWFGYVLLPDTSQQKIAMIVGPKRSGKGTIARVLRALVGATNVCAPTLAGLGTNFGLWPLLGKTAAIISDARLSGRTDAAVVVERLLSISGEDAITVDRKNQSLVTTQLLVRFLILTNELPRLNDPSGALVGRLVLLRLMRSWYGKEDTALTGRLLKELPGILLWAMAGWKRLQDRGHFQQPESGLLMVQDMEDLSSPISAYVRECCEVGPGYQEFIRDLFGRWKTWCEAKGRKEHGNEQTFGRDLRAAVSGLDDCRPRDGRERYRAYKGIRLRADWGGSNNYDDDANKPPWDRG